MGPPAHDALDTHADAPLWMRRPEILHVAAYAVATAAFTAQLVAVLVRGSGRETLLAVLLAGAGVALSWKQPWVGLVVAGAASFAVTEVGRDPLSVWMIAVLVLFSVTLRGKQPVVATGLVAGFFLAAFMTVGGFRGGAVVGCAALFSAVAGGAVGAALRIYREHWRVLDQRARDAVATREAEATRRVVEERLRIARDLHDVVGHQVAMLSVHLGVAEIGLPDDATSSRQALDSARDSARNVVVETQRILALLRRGDADVRDESLQPPPSMGGVDGLLASFATIGLEVEATVDVVDVEPSVGVTVYRIVQEALTNAHRHGDGPAVLSIREVEGAVHVVVENVAGDRPPGRGSGGYGLVGMRERAESAGGSLTVDRGVGTFRVRAVLGPVAAVGAVAR